MVVTAAIQRIWQNVCRKTKDESYVIYFLVSILSPISFYVLRGVEVMEIAYKRLIKSI